MDEEASFQFSDVKSTYSNSPSVTSESGELMSGTSAGGGNSSAPRRRSTRDIKRPKFADEIMDGSSSSNSTAATRRSIGGRGNSHSPTAIVDTNAAVAAVVVGSADMAAAEGIKQEPLCSPVTPNVKSEERSSVKRELDASERAVAAVATAVGDARKSQPPAKKARQSRVSIGSEPTTSAVPVTTNPPPSARHAPNKNAGKNMRNATDAVSQGGAQSHSAALEDAGKWSAVDDLKLVTAVLQVNDLRKVYTGIKFSHRFALPEIEQRWYALMYDPTISRAAKDAMRALPAETVAGVQANTLFTAQEEKLLAAVPSDNESSSFQTSAVSVGDFEQILCRNAAVFHEARNARALHNHWQLMKHYKLLNDQRVLPWTQQPNELSFSEIEDSLDAEPSGSMPVDPLIESELYMAERRLNREVRLLENELPKWQVLTEAVTGINPPDFDGQTMAVLRGRLVRYLIRNKDVVIGRNAHNHTVDVDLSLEGPSYKISRRQGCIKMRPTGEFFITNDGKRPIYVDGQPILQNAKAKLSNNSVIEIGSVRLCFLENQEIMTKIRADSAKMMVV